MLNGLATGDYKVWFYDCRNTGLANEYYDNSPSFASADPVSASAGSDTSAIDAELAQGGTISGAVTDSSSGPLESVCVFAYGEGAGLYPDPDLSLTDFSSYTLTAPDGSYVLPGVPAGEYRVGFTDCGGSDRGIGYATEFYDDKPSLVKADPVAVSAGSDSANTDAVLAEAGSFSGTVTDASSNPLQGVCVEAYNDDGDLVSVSTTDANGVYLVRGVPGGDFRVRFYGCDSGFVGGEFYEGKPSLSPADPFTVSAGSNTAGIDAALAPDTTPPDTTINTGPSGTITTNQATFTFSGYPAADTAKIQCRIDSEPFADCTSPETFSGLTDGPHTAEFRAEDAAGNQDATPATRTFTVDTTPPDTTINTGPSGTITTDQATFTFSGDPAADTAKIQCRIDSEPFADCASPKTFTGLTDGPHTAELQSRRRSRKPGCDPGHPHLHRRHNPARHHDQHRPLRHHHHRPGHLHLQRRPGRRHRQDPVPDRRRAFRRLHLPEDLHRPHRRPPHRRVQSRRRSRKPGCDPGHPHLHRRHNPPRHHDRHRPLRHHHHRSGHLHLQPETRPPTPPRSNAGSTPSPSPTAPRPRPSPASPKAPTRPPSEPKTQPETRIRPRPPASFTVDTTVYEARVSKVKVKGPAKVKKGKKATYKVKISNSGNAAATGVRLQVKRQGRQGVKKTVGKIAAGKTKTVKVKLKFEETGQGQGFLQGDLRQRRRQDREEEDQGQEVEGTRWG